MAKGKWRCASCGAANDETLVRCRLCRSPRPATEAPQGPPGYLRSAEPPPDPQADPALQPFEIPLRDEPRPAPGAPDDFEPEPEPAAPRSPLFHSPGDRLVTYGDDAPEADRPTEPEAPPFVPYVEADEDQRGFEPYVGADDEPGGFEPSDDMSDADVAPDVAAPAEPVGVRPLWMLDQPAPVAAPPPPPSGPDKRLVVALGAIGALVLIVVSVLVLNSGSSPSSTLSPSETVGELLPVTTARPGLDVPTENRSAVGMLPTKGDFGELWSQIELRAGADAFELGPNPSSAQCVLPPPDVPEAGARVDLANYFDGNSVAAQVKVFPDATAASKDVNNAPVTADVTSCLTHAYQAQFAKEGIADAISVTIGFEPAASPGIGEESFAYHLTATVDVGSRRHVQAEDILSWRTGRTVGQLTVSSPFDRDNGPLVGQARDVFTSRFAAL